MSAQPPPRANLDANTTQRDRPHEATGYAQLLLQMRKSIAILSCPSVHRDTVLSFNLSNLLQHVFYNYFSAHPRFRAIGRAANDLAVPSMPCAGTAMFKTQNSEPEQHNMRHGIVYMLF
jgi:hypothetical protein